VQVFDPATAMGVAFYGLLFLSLAIVIARLIRRIVVRLERSADGVHVDRTATLFLMQLAQAAAYVSAGILYAHLVPVLRALGTAMLAGASVASIVLGLPAQNTLGNPHRRRRAAVVPAVPRGRQIADDIARRHRYRRRGSPHAWLCISDG